MGWSNYIIFETQKVAIEIGKVDEQDIDTDIHKKILDVKEYQESVEDVNETIFTHLASKICYDSKELLASLLYALNGECSIKSEYSDDIDWAKYTILRM